MEGPVAAKQIARWVALGALFLLTLTPLVVADTFFFPFITGKAFYFRILVEIAVGAWALLAFIDRAYRPRFSWLGVLVIAFVAWLFVADLFAINVLKAFWSNFERMEGWVLLIHLLGFFFAASNVLRVEKRWRTWFLASLGVSLVVLVYALLQLTGALPIHQGSTRIDASFGNSAYLAVYLLFNTFLAGWLALTEERSWLKRSLLALAAVEALFIFFTETRGTILGLTGALLLAAFLAAITSAGKARTLAASALAVILVLSGGFYLAHDSHFVQGNHILQRIASISLSDGQTRFQIWGMAFDGFAARPVVGWGQEGFNYVFNEYYNPALYNQEPWFDRAHNAFLDWLLAGGLPAFLLYVSLFLGAIILLWKNSMLARSERIALTAALAGYACHNLFVFDNLYSYVYFFAILALIDAQVARPVARFERANELGAEGALTYGLPITALFVAAAIWFVNVPGMNVASELITAMTPSGDVAANTELFKNILGSGTFAAQEVREQLVSLAAGVAGSSSVTAQDKAALMTLAIGEMQKQVAAYPRDARELLELAYAYQAAGDDAGAVKELQAAHELSPKKEVILVQMGIEEWNTGDASAARENFAQAYALGPQFPELAAYAALGEYITGNAAAADALLLKAYGTTAVDNDMLAVAYYRMKDWGRLVRLWQVRASKTDASIQTLFGLAAAYYAAGENAQAIQQLTSIVAAHPETKASVDAAIAQIRSGAPIQ